MYSAAKSLAERVAFPSRFKILDCGGLLAARLGHLSSMVLLVSVTLALRDDGIFLAGCGHDALRISNGAGTNDRSQRVSVDSECLLGLALACNSASLNLLFSILSETLLVLLPISVLACDRSGSDINLVYVIWCSALAP